MSVLEVDTPVPLATLNVTCSRADLSRSLRRSERGAALSLTSTRRKLPLGLGDKCAFTLDNTFFESLPRRRAGGQVPQQGHSWVNAQHRSHKYEL